MSLLSWLLVTLAGLSLAAMVVSISIANRATREARSTIFPIVRDEETTRARRARITTSVTGVVAAILAGAFFLSGQLPSPKFPPPENPTQAVAIAEPAVTVTDTPIPPSETPIPPTQTPTAPSSSQIRLVTVTQPAANTAALPPASPTPVPATKTVTPVPSATATPVPGTPTPTSPPATAPTSAQMGPVTFTTRISDRREPVSPTNVFSDTVNRIYATFPYTGMRDGVNWTQVWYYNGVEYNRGQQTWQWGVADRSYVFTRVVGVGDYRLEIYVNDDLLASGEFQVQGPIAVGGPESMQTPEGQETPTLEGTPESQETPQNQETPERP